MGDSKKNCDYSLELILSQKTGSTEAGIRKVCDGFNAKWESTENGYIIMADSFEDIGSAFGRTIAELRLIAYLEKAFYTSPDEGRYECTEKLMFNPDESMSNKKKEYDYILELELKDKNSITDRAVNDICRGVAHRKESMPSGYRLMADNMNDMGTMYVRTMASLVIRGYLKRAVYTDPEDGTSDCTDDMLCDPELK